MKNSKTKCSKIRVTYCMFDIRLHVYTFSYTFIQTMCVSPTSQILDVNWITRDSPSVDCVCLGNPPMLSTQLIPPRDLQCSELLLLFKWIFLSHNAIAIIVFVCIHLIQKQCWWYFETTLVNYLIFLQM